MSDDDEDRTALNGYKTIILKGITQNGSSRLAPPCFGRDYLAASHQHRRYHCWTGGPIEIRQFGMYNFPIPYGSTTVTR